MIPQFDNKTDLFNWLRENKSLLMHSKKSQLKYADAVHYAHIETGGKEDAQKESGIIEKVNTDIVVRSVINTTNILDSHYDVHIKGLWKKSLNEAKSLYLLQEHQMKFDKVISDQVKAYTQSISWSNLGYSYDGKTEALVFDSVLQQARNPFMFEQYSNGYVKNHSVGMRYVKMVFAVNSEERWWKEEKDNWDKYYPQIVNKEAADELGFFWAVTEAKVVEGSAVLVGSNQATPTISITEAGQKSTSAPIAQEPSADTLSKIKQIKFF